MAAFELDLLALLKRVGDSEDEIVAKLNGLAQTTGTKVAGVHVITVQRWIERNSMPVHRLADVLAVLKAEKKRINIFDFLAPMPLEAQERLEEAVAAPRRVKAVRPFTRRLRDFA